MQLKTGAIDDHLPCPEVECARRHNNSRSAVIQLTELGNLQFSGEHILRYPIPPEDVIQIEALYNLNSDNAHTEVLTCNESEFLEGRRNETYKMNTTTRF